MSPEGQPDSSQLRILLLGHPEVTRNGQIVRINRRENRAGLYYLASHPEPVSRSEICFTFWPDDPEDLARKKLREGLSRLRIALNDPKIFITNNDFVCMDFNRVYVDVLEYSRIVTPLLNSSELNGSDILPDWIYVQLRKAVELCRGSQFLQDSPLHNSTGFDAWVSITDQSFGFSYEKVLGRLAEHCIAQGNIDEAMIWLGKVLSFDQFNTDASFLMLNCMCETRKFKEATDYLALLTYLYASHQQFELPDVLKEIQKRIQREALESKNDSHDDWPVDESNPTPFVGRADLLLRLLKAYHRKGLVHVTGKSGSGKSRLVQEFYSRLEYSPRLLFCAGKPMISSAPYGPIIEGLNRLLTEKEWQSLPDEIKTNLHSLYPEIKFSEKRLSPIIIDPLPDHPVTRIHNALYALLKIIAEKKPLVMVVDIAVWCDDATLNFLTFLNDRKFFKNFGLLILISRSEEHNPTLDALIDQSMLGSNLERIVVPSMSLEETAQLVSQQTGKSVSEDFLRKIHTQTGGTPYMLIETLRALDPYNLDVSTYSDKDFFPIPATIKAVVFEKIRNLSDSTLEVLQSAAVLGKRFMLQVLEKMVNSPDGLLSALEELQGAGIVIGISDSHKASTYDFPHDQFREVVTAELSPVRKRALHLAAARAMLEVQGEVDELASTYAWHFEQAGEFTEAFSAWCVAGRYSRNCFSRQDAYSSFQHALDLLSSVPGKDAPTLLRQLFQEWGDYAYDLFDVSTCEKLFTIGLEYGETWRDPLIIGISISGLGRVAEMRRNIEDGIEYHQKALFFLSKSKSMADQIETYARLGILCEVKDDYSQARDFYLKGLALNPSPSDVGELDASVNIKSQLSILYSQMGYPNLAAQLADQCINESRLIPRLSGRVHAFTALSIAQYYQGKYQKSLQNAFSVYKMAEQLDLNWWVSLLDISIARNKIILGQMDGCWHHLNHAIENQNPDLLYKIFQYHHALKGDVYRLLGNLSAAEEQYRLGTRTPLTDAQSLENYFGLGMVLCQRNELKEGLSIISDCNDRAQALGLESISLTGRLIEMVWTGQSLNAEQFSQQSAPWVAALDSRGFQPGSQTATMIAGVIALKQGDLDKATDCFSEVCAASRKLGHIWFELSALSSLSELMKNGNSVGDPFLERKQVLLAELSAQTTRAPLGALLKKNIKSL